MKTVIEIAEAVRQGEMKAVEVLDQCLDRIASGNEELNAFVVLDPELAREAADAVDAAVARGEDPGPFAGVPFGVKDLEDCAGLPTSHGSLLYKDRPPVTADSPHVARLRAAGAVPVGKTAAPEFGTVAFTHTKAWGTTRNPWNVARTPGGSSGGSAAAVAAALVPFATASDGGGSTRIPAAFSGLVGMKPSHGRIPHPPAATSQTSVYGALTTTVADSARHLDVVAGPDDRDRLSLPASGVKYEDAIEALDVRGLRATWSLDLGFAAVDPEVADIAEGAARQLADAAGLELIDRPVELTDPLRTWMSVGAVDGWLSLEEGMWPDRGGELMGFVRRGYELSEDMTIKAYARRLRYRHRLEDEVAAIFADVDVLLTPSTAVPAFPAEGPMPMEINGREVAAGMAVPFTMLANLCWNPAVSLPAGVNSEGLPVGLQVIGRRHRDDVVLRLARIFEQTPPLAALRAIGIGVSVPAFLHSYAPPARDAKDYIRIVGGEGAVVLDDKGKSYVDALGSLWYCQVGHGRTEIVDAITQQLRQIAGYHTFDRFTNAPADALCERLATLAPMPDAGVFLTSGGSESVDTALKLARVAHYVAGDTKRTLIVSREPSYHGVSYGAMSATGLPLNRQGYAPLVDDIVQVPYDDLDVLDAVISSRGDELAAVIAEPVVGAGGVLPPPPGYLTGLRERCDATGAFLILDEVICGFGRLGSWFGAQHYGVVPDLLTFAKGVTSGYQPLGGVLVGSRVRAALEADPAYMLRHGYTYSGHPAACAAGMANLDIMERETLWDRAPAIGQRLRDGLGGLVDKGHIKSVRGEGGMWAVVLPDGADPSAIRDRMLDRGVIARPLGADAIAFRPPLVVTDAQLDQCVDVLLAAVLA